MVVDVAAKGFPAFNDYMAEHREDVDLDAHHYQVVWLLGFAL